MSTKYAGLDPIEPKDSLRLYLDHKETEYSMNTVQGHRYRLQYFVQWCEEEDLTNLNERTGRHLQEYRLWRKEHGDLKQISLNKQMYTVRAFIKWCGFIEAGPQELFEELHVTRVSPEQQRRDDTLPTETAQKLLDYLSRYHYASVEHAVIALIWATGMRLGAVNSLDATNVDFENRRLTVVHRPDQGTELENGTNGERPLAISPELAALLKDYIEDVREPVTDEYDREPLFGARHGRMARQTIRAIVYRTMAPRFRNEP